MNQQQIYDRRRALNRELASARDRAGELEKMKQKAERQDLISACAAIGHVFIATDTFLGGLSPRYCAFCELSEDAAAQRIARNLTTEPTFVIGGGMYAERFDGRS